MQVTVSLYGSSSSLCDMRGSHLVKALLLGLLAFFLFTDLTAVFSSLLGGSIAHHAPSTNPRKQKISDMTEALKNSCLPKLICELNATPNKDSLSPKAKSLLNLIRDTSISTTGEASSRYHFAAHMGQLISGVDGTGCHNFYPNCPLPGSKVLSLLNRPSLL